MKLRKDASLEQTCKTIIKILHKNHIKVSIKFRNFHKKFYSCRVTLDKTSLGTNGKGLDKSSALASGLAEFMERLQSFKLIRPRFCDKEINNFNVINKVDKQTKILSFAKNYMNISPQTLVSIQDDASYSKLTTYYDLTNQTSILLPYYLVNNLCETNGYCAGNTPSEAISQGICEILERFCVRENLKNTSNIANIDINSLKNLAIYDDLQYIIKLGYNLVIKDFSLQNKFPVVALLIYKNNKYIISAGCDVDIDIALQRCLTEIFQGLNNTNYKSKFQVFKQTNLSSEDNSYLMYINNKAVLSKEIISNDFVALNKLPFKNVQNSQESLEYLVKLIKNENLPIYVKDYSFLNFPTFHVYIPSLSEIHDLNSFNFSSETKLKMNHFFFNFNNLDSAHLEKFSKLIKKEKIARIGNYFGSDSMFKAKINNLSKKGMEFLLNYKLHNLNNKKYKKYFSKFVTPDYKNCANCPLKRKCKQIIWENLFTFLNDKYLEYSKKN